MEDDVGRRPAQEVVEGGAVARTAGQGERYASLLADGDRPAQHAAAACGVQEQVRGVEQCDTAGFQAEREGLQQLFALTRGEQLLGPQQDRPEFRTRTELVRGRPGARLGGRDRRSTAVQEAGQVPEQARLAGARLAQHDLDGLARAAGQGLLLQDARQPLLGAAWYVHVPQGYGRGVRGAVVEEQHVVTSPFADLVDQLPARAAAVAGPSGGELPQLPRGLLQPEAEPGRQRVLGLTEVRQCLHDPLPVLGDRPVLEDVGAQPLERRPVELRVPVGRRTRPGPPVPLHLAGDPRVDVPPQGRVRRPPARLAGAGQRPSGLP
ncbi:hypothetical protein ABZ766_27430 [Streptomyces sp. NPDC006670]|uniref:hypothetical protein n=1 Tax=Streptomyces sp. NPDC006670 TaxID=3154476 RepID=UPI0033CAB234